MKSEINTSRGEKVEQFIAAFFGEGNAIWPDRDPTSQAGLNLAPFLEHLRSGSDAPVILPRKRPTADSSDAYVIAPDPAQAAATAEILTAFVGTSFSQFDGRRARLNPDDPVDQAVLNFAGPHSTFLIRSGAQRAQQAAMWRALAMMQRVAVAKPARLWHLTKPLGRLLAEFDAALAAGENSASEAILEQLAAGSGLSGTNLAHLRIKRLARLGQFEGIMQLDNLADVVAGGAPGPIREAILTAVHEGPIADALAAGDLESASAHLVDRGHLVPALLDSNHSNFAIPAVSVMMLASYLRTELPLLRDLVTKHATGPVSELPTVLLESVESLLEMQLAAAPLPPLATALGSAAESGGRPLESWAAFIKATAAGDPSAGYVLREQTWLHWTSPATCDHQLASLLDDLYDTEAQQVWAAVGAFLDADAFYEPAAQAAHAFVRNALAFDRYTPGDLAALVALTEIVLRSSPDRETYIALLDDLGSEHERWAGPHRTTLVLDLVDLLNRSACPDLDARNRLTLPLLATLCSHRSRLSPDEDAFARQLAEESNIDLEWPPLHYVDGGDPAPPYEIDHRGTVLLYSLDDAVLARTADALRIFAPGVRIHLCNDRAGTSQLRQRVRASDVIVLATRCAQHAATGFIRSNARRTAVIREADGSGSASLIRAAVEGLRAEQDMNQ